MSSKAEEGKTKLPLSATGGFSEKTTTDELGGAAGNPATLAQKSEA